MKTFNWTKAISFGVSIWIIMFALVSFLISMDFLDLLISKIIMVVVAGVLSYLFALNLKLVNITKSFNYAFAWVLIGLILDVLISSRLNAELFSMWEYWLSYAFIFFAPMVSVAFSHKEETDMSHAH